MALDLGHDSRFRGPALPEPFVQTELERELTRLGLLPRATGADGKALQESWDGYRRRLRELAVRAGAVRVRNHVVEPLVERLGYARLTAADDIETREGRERGGDILVSADGLARLRVWCVELDEDLDAPARRGAAFRYSHLRIAQRVLLAAGERVGLLTNGTELRLLLSDPARPDSEVEIAIDPSWRRSRGVPDSYRLLLALASPAGVRAVPESATSTIPAPGSRPSRPASGPPWSCASCASSSSTGSGQPGSCRSLPIPAGRPSRSPTSRLPSAG